MSASAKEVSHAAPADWATRFPMPPGEPARKVAKPPLAPVPSGVAPSQFIPLELPLDVRPSAQEKDRYSDHASELVGSATSLADQHASVRRYQEGIVKLAPALGKSPTELLGLTLADGEAGAYTMRSVDAFRRAFDLLPDTPAEEVTKMVAALTGPGIEADLMMRPYLSLYATQRPMLVEWAACPRLTPAQRGELLATLLAVDEYADELIDITESHSNPDASVLLSKVLAETFQAAEKKISGLIAAGC